MINNYNTNITNHLNNFLKLTELYGKNNKINNNDSIKDKSKHTWLEKISSLFEKFVHKQSNKQSDKILNKVITYYKENFRLHVTEFSDKNIDIIKNALDNVHYHSKNSKNKELISELKILMEECHYALESKKKLDEDRKLEFTKIDEENLKRPKLDDAEIEKNLINAKLEVYRGIKNNTSLGLTELASILSDFTKFLVQGTRRLQRIPSDDIIEYTKKFNELNDIHKELIKRKENLEKK